MKKLLPILCIFLYLTANISYAGSEACPTPPVQPNQEAFNQGAKNAKDHGFLWRISKNERISYLYGTLHLARFEDMFPGPVTREVLVQADTIALELDMLDPDIMSRLTQTISTTKSHSIPEELSKKIQQAAKAQCLQYESIENMMPELQVITLQLLQARQDSLYADYAIDMVISGFGHASKKNMVSLETPEMQIETLRVDSQAELIDFVKEGLSDIESKETRELMLRMFDGWKSANYDDFGNYADWCKCMDTDMDKKYMLRLLGQRNLNMANNIDKLHTSGKTVFAAVGSLHMFGEKNLPDLMRKLGYQVEIVQFKN